MRRGCLATERFGAGRDEKTFRTMASNRSMVVSPGGMGIEVLALTTASYPNRHFSPTALVA